MLSAAVLVLSLLLRIAPVLAQQNSAPAIKLEPVELVLHSATFGTRMLSPDMKWTSPTGKGGMNHFVPLGDGIDALWTPGGLLLLDAWGTADEVLADGKLQLADVVGDGRYIWASASYGRGVFILSPDGQTLATIDANNGLPASDAGGPVLHPIAPGRVLAAGDDAKHHCAWIATLTISTDAVKVEMFHEAAKQWPQTVVPAVEFDPGMYFKPTAFFEIPSANPQARRLIFMPRGKHNPLVLDVTNHRMGVYPSRDPNGHSFSRSEAGRDGAVVAGGLLWVAGAGSNFQSYKFADQAGMFSVERRRENWDIGNQRAGSLALDGQWLYYAGVSCWRRVNLSNGREELLISDPRVLPNYGSGENWTLARSSRYGLVAFNGGTLYRVHVPAEASPTTAQAVSAADRN
ncbi:MAG TPA: hypothetical protein VHD56_12905 [Tepidisphaeraceae bacterium]|nr:hypothetical protein [Tepidisphaeraceae bacterium]